MIKSELNAMLGNISMYTSGVLEIDIENYSDDNNLDISHKAISNLLGDMVEHRSALDGTVDGLLIKRYIKNSDHFLYREGISPFHFENILLLSLDYTMGEYGHRGMNQNDLERVLNAINFIEALMFNTVDDKETGVVVERSTDDICLPKLKEYVAKITEDIQNNHQWISDKKSLISAFLRVSAIMLYREEFEDRVRKILFTMEQIGVSKEVISNLAERYNVRIRGYGLIDDVVDRLGMDIFNAEWCLRAIIMNEDRLRRDRLDGILHNIRMDENCRKLSMLLNRELKTVQLHEEEELGF